MTPERRLEILKTTKSLISHPSRWGQGTMVQHPLIDRLMMRPPRMCLVAALSAAIHGVEPIIADRLLWDRETAEVHDYLWERTGSRPVSPYGRQLMSWNDRVEHGDVVWLIDIAILDTLVEIDSAPSAQQPDDGADDQQDDQDGPKHDAAVPPTV